MPRTATVVLLAAFMVSSCSGGSPASAPAGSDGTATGSTPTSSTAPASTAPGSTPTASPTAAAPVVPRAPRRAACYRLTTGQLTRPTNDSRPVPCSREHTSRTIHVGRLDTVVDGHSVAVDSDTVQAQLVTTCRRKLVEYVGGSPTTRALARLNVVWYSPTLAQSDRGADWFRCDVIAFAEGDRLLPLRGASRLKRVLDRPGALDTYGLCGTAAPGTRGFARVVCGRNHAWRAIRTIDLAGPKRYPGVTTVREAGDASCKDAARERADDALRFAYGWEWPTADQWSAGQRFGYCWVPD